MRQPGWAQEDAKEPSCTDSTAETDGLCPIQSLDATNLFDEVRTTQKEANTVTAVNAEQPKALARQSFSPQVSSGAVRTAVELVNSSTNDLALQEVNDVNWDDGEDGPSKNPTPPGAFSGYRTKNARVVPFG